MRKFNVRWWVDPEFLGRRTDHNIDTFELLLEQYGLWQPFDTLMRGFDPALHGPKSSTVFSYESRKNELRDRMNQAAEAAIDAAKAFTAAQAEYGRYITRFPLWAPWEL